MLFSILDEEILPFSKQPEENSVSGSKSSTSPAPSAKDEIGASAHTGIAVLQSPEVCAFTKVKQHKNKIAVKIGNRMDGKG